MSKKYPYPKNYDPRLDPRSCDESRGDVQCPARASYGGGYLCCQFKSGHMPLDDHHTYVIGDEEYEWVMPSELEIVQNALAAAAKEINCAGPVAHRIRVLKKEYEDLLEQKGRMIAVLDKELQECKKSNWANRRRADSAEGELARLKEQLKKV